MPVDALRSKESGAQDTAMSAYAETGATPRRPLSELEQAIGYSFKNEDYLRAAMVHKSYLHDVPDFNLGSNERLEFLGDAALGFVVSSDLFKEHEDVAEGQLTAWRGALVRLSTLAEVAEPLALGEYLYMSHGEEAAGGRARPSNMGRAVEALLGAVYLDGGLEAAADVWHRALGGRSIEQMQAVLAGDYKSQLQQFTQAHLKATPLYRLVNTSGPAHAQHFHIEVVAGDRVLASGSGKNKQIAEQAAAQQALAALTSEEAANNEGEDEERRTKDNGQ